MDEKNLITFTPDAESWYRLSTLYPIISSFESLEQFSNWTKENPQLNLNSNQLWRGKEALELYSNIRGQHEEQQMQNQGYVDSTSLPNSLVGLPLIALGAIYRQKPKIMEEDARYKKIFNDILEKKKEEWQKQGKSLSDKEWLNYTYNLSDEDYFYNKELINNRSSLSKDAEKEFREKHKKESENYDKTREKEKKKMYKNPEDDPFVKHAKSLINDRTKNIHEILKKDNPSITEEEVRKKVEKRVWDEFVLEHPEKTEKYIKNQSSEYNALQKSYESVQTKNGLKNYEEETKKQIRYVDEKLHREPEVSTRIEDATKRLETAASSTKTLTPLDQNASILVNPRGKVISTITPLPPTRPLTPQFTQRQFKFQPFTNLITKMNNFGGGFIGGGKRGMRITRNPFDSFAQKMAMNLGKQIATKIGASLLMNPYVLIGIIVLIIIITVIILFSSIFGGGGGGGGFTGGGTVGGDITTCTFYRGGDSIKEATLKNNPQMASLISNISTTIEVPPAIVAGIMRVESPSQFVSTDETYLKNDYDAHSSGVAYGLMQFTPKTFEGIFKYYKDQMKDLFNKTDVTVNIDSQDKMAPENVLRIYSVRDSIIAAAFKVKKDKTDINNDGPWDEDTITEIARRYYGCVKYPSCSTGPYSYGEDLWNSYKNCQETAIAQISLPPDKEKAICPVANGNISCGPSKPTTSHYSACNQGHCAGDYGFPSYCATYPSTSYAIDIPGKSFEPVYIPFLTIPTTGEIHSLTCNYVTFEKGSFNPQQIITQFSCTDNQNKNKVWLQFHHLLDGSQPSTKGPFQSGDAAAGKIDPDTKEKFPHTHVQIGINGGCGLDSSGCVAADKYLQCR